MSLGDCAANFYLWGAMGSAALVGLGLAQAQPDRTVVVITGDGEQLMGLGGLATIGVAKPKNLVIVVIDNDHFGETGMQQSHTGLGLELAECGAGLRHRRTRRSCATSRAPRSSAAKFTGRQPGRASSSSRSRPKICRARCRRATQSYVKNRFRAHLGFAPI